MRWRIFLTGLAVVSLFVCAAVFAAGEHKFIGSPGCKQCHKGVAQGNQYEIWESSKHAKAFETLKSEAASKIANSKGLTVPAFEAKECLECHTTGAGADPALLDAKFKKEMGVQCEACHGAGFDYRGMTTMKDRKLSIEKGMTPMFVSDGTAEKMCRSCHNEKSPTFKGFDFSQMWSQIEHPRLKKSQ